MTTGATRPLAELRNELAQQDAQWARAKAQLRAAIEGLGDVTLRVPNEALEAIDRVCAQASTRDVKSVTPMTAIARRG